MRRSACPNSTAPMRPCSPMVSPPAPPATSAALAARNGASLAQARALADGAIMRVVFDLMRPRTRSELWQADGAVHFWDEDGARIAANAIDESGKIDLNTASDALLKGYLQSAG